MATAPQGAGRRSVRSTRSSSRARRPASRVFPMGVAVGGAGWAARFAAANRLLIRRPRRARVCAHSGAQQHDNRLPRAPYRRCDRSLPLSPSHRYRANLGGRCRRAAAGGGQRHACADTTRAGGEQRHRRDRCRHRGAPGAHHCRGAQGRAGTQPVADRRRGRHRLGVHARHQLQPHQGAHRRDRRRRSQQLDRCLRLRPAAHPGHRARGGAARPAERAVRLGRHRRCHQHHHQERQRADAVPGLSRRGLLRDLQPGRRHLRFRRRVPLRGQCQPLSLGLDAGDAPRPAAAG